jgi:hypothetical protein
LRRTTARQHFKATAKTGAHWHGRRRCDDDDLSIIVLLTDGLTDQVAISKLSILHAPFLLGCSWAAQ